MLTAQYFSTCTQHDTLRLPRKNTHARGIGDVLTHQLENDPGAYREGSHRQGDKKVEKEEVHTVMLRKIMSVVPLWASSGTLKLLHSTCHCGPPL